MDELAKKTVYDLMIMAWIKAKKEEGEIKPLPYAATFNEEIIERTTFLGHMKLNTIYKKMIWYVPTMERNTCTIDLKDEDLSKLKSHFGNYY